MAECTCPPGKVRVRDRGDGLIYCMDRNTRRTTKAPCSDEPCLDEYLKTEARLGDAFRGIMRVHAQEKYEKCLKDKKNEKSGIAEGGDCPSGHFRVDDDFIPGGSCCVSNTLVAEVCPNAESPRDQCVIDYARKKCARGDGGGGGGGGGGGTPLPPGGPGGGGTRPPGGGGGACLSEKPDCLWIGPAKCCDGEWLCPDGVDAAGNPTYPPRCTEGGGGGGGTPVPPTGGGGGGAGGACPIVEKNNPCGLDAGQCADGLVCAAGFESCVCIDAASNPNVSTCPTCTATGGGGGQTPLPGGGGGQQPPTGGNQPPTGGNQPPTGGQQPPTGGQQPPQVPTGGQQPPQTPTGGGGGPSFPGGGQPQTPTPGGGIPLPGGSGGGPQQTPAGGGAFPLTTGTGRFGNRTMFGAVPSPSRAAIRPQFAANQRSTRVPPVRTRQLFQTLFGR